MERKPSSLMSDEVHFLNEEYYILFASLFRDTILLDLQVYYERIMLRSQSVKFHGVGVLCFWLY
jgi:hypothetical protein